MVAAGAACLATPLATAQAAPPRFDHVVIVMEENHDYSQVVNNASCPYINNTLIAGGAVFTNSVAITHPSEPNYLAIFSGSTQGVTDDTCPPPGSQYTSANLAAGLLGAGWTFAGYSEGLPAVGSLACTSGSYARKHNAWVNWQGTGTNQIPTTTNQPFTSFPSDFTTLPTVSFVVPNVANDMHDQGTEATADTWLATHVDGFAQWAKTHNSLLILTFDEGDASPNNQILTVFYGASVLPGSYGEAVNHYRVLRTVEDMYGVPPAGSSAGQTAITDCWSGGPPPPPPPTGLSRWRGSNDATTLHYRFQYAGTQAFRRVYVDKDRSLGTGYHSTSVTVGADFLIENGTLYQYAGTGTNWSWTAVSPNPVVQTTGTSGGMNSIAWDLPIGSIGASFTDTNLQFQVETSGALQTTPAYEHVYSSEDPANPFHDWYGENDQTNLYYHNQIGPTYGFVHVFLDSDLNAATGYPVPGHALGADYMIENGTLYGYTGSGGSWSWSSLGSANEVISAGNYDWQIARSSVGLAASGAVANVVFHGGGNGQADFYTPIVVERLTQ